MSLIHNSGDGVEFHEDAVNGSHKIVVRRPTALSSDVYVDLPTTSGQLATEVYVNNSTGGTFLGLTEDFTNTDATSTTVDVTGISFEAEANRAYYIEGVMLMADVAAASSGCVTFSVPSGTTWTGFAQQARPGSFEVATYPWTDTYAWEGVGAAVAGEITNYDSDGAFSVPIVFQIVMNISSTAGTVKLRFTNRAGDGTVQGLRKGSFIRVIDPQG